MTSWGRGVGDHSDLNRPHLELSSCSCLRGERGAESPHGGTGEGRTRGPLPLRGSGGRPPRKRHPEWLKAQKVVHELITDLSDISKYELELLKLANDYYHDVKDNVIILQHKKKNKILALPYKTRFHDIYIEEFMDKLKKLKEHLVTLNSRNTFLTVTAKPREISTLSDYYKLFSRNLSILLNRIKRKYGYGYSITVLELQKNGNLHAHILFIDIPYIPLKWLKKQLKTLGFGSEHIKGLNGSVDSAVNYAIKYFKKGLIGDSSSHEKTAKPSKHKKKKLVVLKTEYGIIKRWEYPDNSSEGLNFDTTENNSEFVCPFCNSVFFTKTDFDCHLHISHGFHGEVTLHKAVFWALNLKQYRMSKSCLEVLARFTYRVIHPASWIYVGMTTRYFIPHYGIIIDEDVIFSIYQLLDKPPPMC